MAFTPPGGDPVQLLAGSQFAYLHRPQTPSVKGGTEWWVSLTHTLPDQDIETTSLIQQAVSSLWNVARRRYTGQAGEVWLVPAQAVCDAIYSPVAVKGGYVRTLTHELVKKDANGRFNGVDMHLSGRENAGPLAVVETAWRAVPGQRSGITWHYVQMLAGIPGVKPDRMICRFVADALGMPRRAVTNGFALRILTAAAAEMGMSPTDLDHGVWQWQRRRR
jgi:hypothetical protein